MEKKTKQEVINDLDQVRQKVKDVLKLAGRPRRVLESLVLEYEHNGVLKHALKDNFSFSDKSADRIRQSHLNMWAKAFMASKKLKFNATYFAAVLNDINVQKKRIRGIAYYVGIRQKFESFEHEEALKLLQQSLDREGINEYN